MKSFGAIFTAIAGVVSIASAETVQGFDVSDYQSSVNWGAAYNSGARYVMIKVSEKADQLIRYRIWLK